MQKNWLTNVIVASCVFLINGCYTSARHVSSVRPDRVKADARINKTYYIADIVLDNEFYNQRAQAEINFKSWMKNCPEYIKSEYGKYGVHTTLSSAVNQKWQNQRAEDTKLLKVALIPSLRKHYPSLFPSSGGQIGLTIAISYDFKYRNEPSDWSIFRWWLVPDFSTKETYWKLCVRQCQTCVNTHDMFLHLRGNAKKFPRPTDISGGVRETIMWESFLLPTGWIPVPGEADWTSIAFFRFSPSTPVAEPVKVALLEDAFRYLAFDPDCDGDVLAAAIVKCLNRQARQQADKKLIGGGK